ncbi:MAG: glycosyltransferase family 9 protein [Vicinamibacterales bacterium]
MRLGALGDLVHALPVATALRRTWPAARIDWLVSAKFRGLLDLCPIVDRRITIESGGSRAWAALAGTVGELRRERYDAAIDVQGLIKSAVLAKLSGAARTIGFSARYARESLASLFYSDPCDPGGPGWSSPNETRHIVEVNLALLKPLGLDIRVPEFVIEAPVSARVRELIAEVGGRYALLNVGAAWPNKRWAASRFGELAGRLRERHGLPSIVLWGPSERAFAHAAADASHGAAVVAPLTSLDEIAGLARAAVVMVSGDTGPAHLAAAVGARVVGIYGPTRPERNGPFGQSHDSVSRAAQCECHHLRRCRRARPCLEDIGVDEVLEAVDRRLSVSARP